MLQRFNLWRLANHPSLPLAYLLSNTLEVLAIADWAWQTRLNTLMVKMFSRVVESRAISVDMVRWAYTWHDYHRDCDRLIQLWRSNARRAHSARFGLYANREQTAADESYDRLLINTQHFAFDSQEWRPPWPPARLWFQVPWCLRLYATQCRLCSLHRVHGCPAAQVVQARSPVGPTLVPVPHWWRRNVPLCLPDVADWPIVELPDKAPHPPGRSSYKKRSPQTRGSASGRRTRPGLASRSTPKQHNRAHDCG